MATGKERDEGERGKKTIPVTVTIYHIYSKIRVAEMNDPFYNHTFFFLIFINKTKMAYEVVVTISMFITRY